MGWVELSELKTPAAEVSVFINWACLEAIVEQYRPRTISSRAAVVTAPIDYCRGQLGTTTNLQGRYP
jgi:hypothetical protein